MKFLKEHKWLIFAYVVLIVFAWMFRFQHTMRFAYLDRWTGTIVIPTTTGGVHVLHKHPLW